MRLYTQEEKLYGEGIPSKAQFRTEFELRTGKKFATLTVEERAEQEEDYTILALSLKQQAKFQAAIKENTSTPAQEATALKLVDATQQPSAFSDEELNQAYFGPYYEYSPDQNLHIDVSDAASLTKFNRYRLPSIGHILTRAQAHSKLEQLCQRIGIIEDHFQWAPLARFTFLSFAGIPVAGVTLSEITYPQTNTNPVPPLAQYRFFVEASGALNNYERIASALPESHPVRQFPLNGYDKIRRMTTYATNFYACKPTELDSLKKATKNNPGKQAALDQATRLIRHTQELSQTLYHTLIDPQQLQHQDTVQQLGTYLQDPETAIPALAYLLADNPNVQTITLYRKMKELQESGNSPYITPDFLTKLTDHTKQIFPDICLTRSDLISIFIPPETTGASEALHQKLQHNLDQIIKHPMGKKGPINHQLDTDAQALFGFAPPQQIQIQIAQIGNTKEPVAKLNMNYTDGEEALHFTASAAPHSEVLEWNILDSPTSASLQPAAHATLALIDYGVQQILQSLPSQPNVTTKTPSQPASSSTKRAHNVDEIYKLRKELKNDFGNKQHTEHQQSHAVAASLQPQANIKPILLPEDPQILDELFTPATPEEIARILRDVQTFNNRTSYSAPDFASLQYHRGAGFYRIKSGPLRLIVKETDTGYIPTQTIRRGWGY